MRQFTLRLDVTQQRTVVLLKNTLTALLDTGAYIPIWTDEEDILVSELGGQLVKKNVPFIGFGGTAYGNLYQITLEVGNLVFPHMHIVANSELNTSYNLILSATMFDGLIYEVNTTTHRLNIFIPDGETFVRNLKVIDNSGVVHVLSNKNHAHMKVGGSGGNS